MKITDDILHVSDLHRICMHRLPESPSKIVVEIYLGEAKLWQRLVLKPRRKQLSVGDVVTAASNYLYQRKLVAEKKFARLDIETKTVKSDANKEK